ncbi:hypothetical protein NA57DRAFT_42328 [Rhizodiscina lignyota]|uniref:Lccl domain-containing protein n=1 Tax=Rhizodiscina lignyota TaxID=1504668 RepID=A0A9P4I9R7_9PEZI|nr:hypothetical protein NA57DRAFT_42328 [Rhizodiscina lignyota]
MAAPESANLKNLSGQWVMNKKLSGEFDSILALQGIGWLTRSAISLATITLHLKQYNAEDGVEHVDIDQVLTGGIKGTAEHRVLNDEWRDHTDHIFGHVRARSRRTKLSSLKDDDEDEKFLKTDWTQDVIDGDEVIDGQVESQDNGWTARQSWGFEVIDGERRHCRHAIVHKGDEVKRVKLVYDYKGPLDG